MVEIFGSEGLLKEVHKAFEFRPEQLEMAEFVLERIAERENGMIEAGTGVGKTLAYLIPAILYCMENDKRVAVSTETKALQKQIIDKDIELAREVLKAYTGREFRFELCLGSSNYPCRKRFETLITRGRLSKGDADKIESLHGLLESGRIFSRFDIRIDNKLWNRIYREPEICNFYSCPYSARCVFQRARKKWSEADVLIMNHYLFFTNIITGRTYLPPFDIVIFDEAHSVEDIASVQLGFDLSYAQIMEVISGLYRKNRRNNIISSISKGSVRKKAIAALNRISTRLNSFFEYLRERYLSQKSSVRLVEGIDFGDELIEEMEGFFTLLQGAEDHIDNEHARIEFDILRGRLFVYLQCLISAVFLEREHYVYWVERAEDALIGDIHLKGQPIDISDTMWQEVNSFYESNLYFSATLTVNGDFSFFEKRLGIARHKSLLLDSPFDYSRVILFLSKDGTDPENSLYVDRVSELSADIISHLEGNCLLLFTSYRMLNDVRERLSVLIDLPIYAQGQFSANEVLDKYIETDGSVLMGTHSFWQGIDLPGDLLRGVCLMRLPFSVPDRPDVEAKMERLEQQGLNPFYHYQIPNAIIRFRQGFGRLIRGSQDRGIIAVLDTRIMTRSYGKLFIQSIPECRTIFNADELMCAIEQMKGIG